MNKQLINAIKTAVGYYPELRPMLGRRARYIAALVAVKHLAGTEFDHDQSTHGSGGGAGYSQEKLDNIGSKFLIERGGIILSDTINKDNPSIMGAYNQVTGKIIIYPVSGIENENALTGIIAHENVHKMISESSNAWNEVKQYLWSEKDYSFSEYAKYFWEVPFDEFDQDLAIEETLAEAAFYKNIGRGYDVPETTSSALKLMIEEKT